MKNLVKHILYRLLSPVLFMRGRKGSIYITFDDGPHPENTPKIIDILDKYNVKATFFVTGSEMESYPDIIRSLIDNGHTIGYHSYSHKSYKQLKLYEIIKDLSYGQKLAEKFNYNFRFFRPPYGDLTIFSLIYLVLSGWKVVMWSLDSRDSFSNSEQVIDNVEIAKISDGDILLFHDDYDMTVELLPKILDDYNKHNLSLKSL